MSFDVPPVGPVSVSAGHDVASRRPRLPADAAAISSGDIPEHPPAEVLDAMHQADRLYRDLQAQGREVRFELAEGGGVTVELGEVDGEALRTLTPSALLDAATGGSLD